MGPTACLINFFLALVQLQPHVHSTLGVIPLFFHPIEFKKMNYLIFFLLLHFENPVLQTRPNDWRLPMTSGRC
jgi:hypothetical protein